MILRDGREEQSLIERGNIMLSEMQVYALKGIQIKVLEYRKLNNCSTKLILERNNEIEEPVK